MHDVYTRSSSAPISGWGRLAHEATNIQRKVEKDWHKSYLCRKSGAAQGSISWKVDLEGLNVAKISVDLGKLETFNNGQIHATVCCGDFCSRVPAETGELIITL